MESSKKQNSMLENKKNFFSFGRYLMEIRLAQGIKIEDVSKSTKIGVETLLYIENEDHSALPAQVFVKGFLRTYAKVINADGNEAVKRYIASRGVYETIAHTERDVENLNSKYCIYLLIAILLLFGDITLSFLFFSP